MATIHCSCLDAVSDIASGSCIMVGGFGVCGSPESLLDALLQRGTGANELTLISGTGGSSDTGLGRLICRGRVKRLMSTYIGANKEIYRRHLDGQLELELLPQGTFAERIRAGGNGVAAFYTKTGVGTSATSGGVPLKYSTTGDILEVSQAKEIRQFDGVDHALETALKADVALVKAWRADRAGNLQFRLAANNFNSVMCQAASVTIVEVEELVECGQIPPDQIHVPAVFVQRLVLTEQAEKPVQKRPQGVGRQHSYQTMKIARRVAVEFEPNSFANVGLGIPMVAASCIPSNMNVSLHSENGVLGLGRYPVAQVDIVDPDLINASRDCVTLQAGGSCFDSATSFGIVTGGHLSMTVLGATQVSQFGDLANWILPGVAAVGMGGAMELVSCGMKVVVAMRHCTRDGRPKILANCTLPLTGRGCVDLIVTNLAVFSVDRNDGLTLLELADGVTLAEVAVNTACQFAVSPTLRPMRQVAAD